MESPETPASNARRHRWLAVAWIALLWLPCLQMVFRPFPEGPATVENRRKAEPPHLRGPGLGALKAFTESFEKYFSDTFGFRDDLIRTSTLLHLRGLRTSPLATIAIGRDGWLYYNNAGDGVNLADYCGLQPFSEKELDAIERNLASIHEALRQRGIGFAVLAAPSKHSIYPEHLPERIRKLGGTTRLDQLSERLSRRPDILFVDVRRALREAKGSRPLYFRTDTHWNGYGAHLAARQLLAALAGGGVPVSVPSDQDLLLRPRDRLETDLTNLLGLPGDGHEQDLVVSHRGETEERIFELPVETDPALVRVTRTCETGGAGPRFLLVQDSFGTALAPSLCQAFPRGVFLWDVRVRAEHLTPAPPEVVILEVTERYLEVLSYPGSVAPRAGARIDNRATGL